MKIGISEIGNWIRKLENWNFENLELNLEIGIFEEVFKSGILKINT